MNAFSLSGLLVGITCSIMSVWVYGKNRSNPINRLWGIFCIAVAIWGFGVLAIGREKNPSNAIIIWRIAYEGVILIPGLFYHFVSKFLGHKRKAQLVGVYIISAIFFVANTTDLMIPGVRPFFDFYYLSPPGALYPYFFAFFVAMVFLSHWDLWKFLVQTRDNLRKTQVAWFFMATMIGFSGGLTCFVPVFGFDLYPYGNFTVPLYPIIMSYAIVKHGLMDIEVIIRRTAVFTGLFAFVYGIFTVVTIIGQEFFKNSLGWNQWVAMIPTVLIITFALRPLEIFLTNTTEKFLFQKKYDYRELLKTFTNEVLTVLDLQRLTEQTVSGLVRIIKLESACMLVYDRETRRFKMAAGLNVKEKDLVLAEEDTLITYLKATHQSILKDKGVDTMEGHSALREEFKRLNAQLCLPVSLHDDLIGVLCLGMKKSGEEYTQEDIDILTTLARTEAIAISNARLFDELSKTQAEAAQREKMAVIGTLAAGINHEICNPLGIVRGQCEMFLLNLRDGIFNEKSREEILKISVEVMNKVIKETDRATGITKKLSSFAKPSKRSEFEEVHVEKETMEVVDLVGHDLKLNNIEVRRDFPADFPTIMADRKQIQEVLFNIIRNAAQAMDKDQGRIAVSGFTQNGSAVVRIADNGSGIPKDKLDQIFHPFYTTKAPGKGTGLGLFIVKQVVERNQGAITVESELGHGTTFTLRFPKAAKPVQAAS